MLSVLAPASNKTNGSLDVGITVAIAGLFTPSNVLSFNVAAATAAPVLPAEKIASALPSFTRSIAREIEESFFFLMADAGASPISTTSVAEIISIQSGISFDDLSNSI